MKFHDKGYTDPIFPCTFTYGNISGIGGTFIGTVQSLSYYAELWTNNSDAVPW